MKNDGMSMLWWSVVIFVLGFLVFVGVQAATQPQPERERNPLSPSTISIIATYKLDTFRTLHLVKIGGSGCALLFTGKTKIEWTAENSAGPAALTTLPTDACNGR